RSSSLLSCHAIFFAMTWLPPRPTLFPYTTLFRSLSGDEWAASGDVSRPSRLAGVARLHPAALLRSRRRRIDQRYGGDGARQLTGGGHHPAPRRHDDAPRPALGHADRRQARRALRRAVVGE